MNLNKKKFLITGGTGSFGNAVLKRLLKTNISEIRILSRDEKKQFDLRKKISDKRLKFYLGDVRNFESVLEASKGVDYIFHAAALKQVPSCEFFPMEAVNTNIVGADNVTRAADQLKVKKCILLSTDKAVYPINAMGLSKSMMEKIMIAKSRNSKTIFCATRYGNVMGTRGSVIPLFVEQIQNNLNVTITNENMTRFLMSIEESVDLVFYALKNAKSGDIYVQKSPACTIKTLVLALKNILKKSKLSLKTIGIRHGEKMHETLVSDIEMSKAVEKPKYFIIPKDKRDLNYDKFFVKGDKDIKNLPEYNSNNTKRLNEKEVISLLKMSKVLSNFVD
jgi:UDP-N-acetylglucosamine 4,6-dehydratase